MDTNIYVTRSVPASLSISLNPLSVESVRSQLTTDGNRNHPSATKPVAINEHSPVEAFGSAACDTAARRKTPPHPAVEAPVPPIEQPSNMVEPVGLALGAMPLITQCLRFAQSIDIMMQHGERIDRLKVELYFSQQRRQTLESMLSHMINKEEADNPMLKKTLAHIKDRLEKLENLMRKHTDSKAIDKFKWATRDAEKAKTWGKELDCSMKTLEAFVQPVIVDPARQDTARQSTGQQNRTRNGHTFVNVQADLNARQDTGDWLGP